jgi:hypothetical protein
MAHYSIQELGADPDESREMLRGFFPDGEANDLNFVLFSTSGVHGTYLTIEDIEKDLAEPEEDRAGLTLTTLVVQPRLVCLRYGNIRVHPDDIEWLKRLRASSLAAAAKIGTDATNA